MHNPGKPFAVVWWTPRAPRSGEQQQLRYREPDGPQTTTTTPFAVGDGSARDYSQRGQKYRSKGTTSFARLAGVVERTDCEFEKKYQQYRHTLKEITLKTLTKRNKKNVYIQKIKDN